MPVFRRRRGHVFLGAFNAAANGEYYTDDAQTEAYYFDDSITLRYVAQD